MSLAMDVPKDIQDKLAQFQNLQNQLQMAAIQKQQLALRKADLENAKKELGAVTDGKVYRMVGPLLVELEKEKAVKYLDDESESTNAKHQLMEKQEKKLADKMNQMRGELQAIMKPGQGAG